MTMTEVILSTKMDKQKKAFEDQDLAEVVKIEKKKGFKRPSKLKEKDIEI
jgi:hypothetical protein